jgi:hypothetical protein
LLVFDIRIENGPVARPGVRDFCWLDGQAAERFPRNRANGRIRPGQARVLVPCSNDAV